MHTNVAFDRLTKILAAAQNFLAEKFLGTKSYQVVFETNIRNYYMNVQEKGFPISESSIECLTFASRKLKKKI